MDTSFVSGWMIGVPLVLLVSLLVWALVDSASTVTFDIEENGWNDEDDWPYDWKEQGL